MNRLDYIENMWEIASCYDAGLPKDYFPLCEMSGKKFVYHKERDEDTQELTEEICVTDEWSDIPLPVSTEEESAIDNYFFPRHRPLEDDVALGICRRLTFRSPSPRY